MRTAALLFSKIVSNTGKSDEYFMPIGEPGNPLAPGLQLSVPENHAWRAWLGFGWT